MKKTKICSTCGKEKPLEDFPYRYDANTPEGERKRRGTCRTCIYEYNKRYYKERIEANPERLAAHRAIARICTHRRYLRLKEQKANESRRQDSGA